MPTRYTGRVVIILLVILGSLWALFPNPAKVFDREIPWSQKLNLKPGIDMVGGSSLLYEIKPPEGAGYRGNLVEQVMGPLKRRVDPEGVKNLIWRPQGETRLEIQMPLLAGSEDAETKRQALIEARRELERTNVTPAEVIAIVEGVGAYKDKTPEQRQRALDELAMGSPERKGLFTELKNAYERMQQARERKDVAATVAAEDAYHAAQAKIEATNLTVADLEQDLALNGAARTQKIQEDLNKAKDFPARQEAIKKMVAATDEFAKVRNLVDNVADLKRKLQGAGVLEFHIAAVPPSLERGRGRANISQAEYDAAVDRLKKHGPRAVAGEPTRWFLVEREDEARGQTVEYGGKRYVLGWVTPDKSMDNREGRANWKLIDVHSGPKSQLDPQQVVVFTFDPQGGKYFSELTGANIDQPLMTILDGKLISMPYVNSRIGETGIIEGGGEGGFTPQQLDYLVSTMAAGSLPAQLTEEPISETTVGPQLGRDNLMRGLASCAFGVVVVAVFLIGYYYRAGVVAFLAVLMNLLIILGAMALLNATFTLPSVAGIVLTIGMAVDANVLIFERLREEQIRGLSLRQAMRNAYDKAWSAILDANVTTAITAAVVYYFGSEEVKGFGLTLLIGLVSSLFTSLFVTKTIFGLLIDRGHLTKLGSLPLTFPKWDRMLRPHIDWMGLSKYFIGFSVVFIAVGLTAFVAKLAQGQLLDVEFTKGTSVQFELLQPMHQDEVRRLVEAQSERTPAALPSPYVVAVGSEGKSYEVVTANYNAQQVRDAILAAMRDPKDTSKTLLKLEEPATFALDNHTVDEAIQGGVVVPIRTANQQVAGFIPGKLASHVGGAAVVLKDMKPRLTPEDIKNRLDRQRLQVESRTGAGIRIDVERAPDPDTVVILASDPSWPYDDEALKAQQWKDEVAAPVWRLANEAVTKPAGLQRVTNFDPQVAGDATRDAFVAVAVSILGIMAYIWLRFGNFKYGSATVVALLHDAAAILAAIGLSHYLSAVPFIKHALVLEPFRINLTMVAAILTVMGWSMYDTVVVFDRIRENRDKTGHLDRQIINDSISQTLSRTILAGLTTMLTIFVMYVFGGAGIHGFTFALLIGIVVGMYSSVAIAAPMLLLGRDVQQAKRAAASAQRPKGRLQQAGA